MDDDVSVESANDEPAVSDVTDDVDLTSSPSPTTTAATAAKTVSGREDASRDNEYCSKLEMIDRVPHAYFPALPFQYPQQRLTTAEERLLLPLVHSILLQRHHHQQQQLHLQAASVLSADRQSAAGLKLGLLDHGVVAGTTQTSPAGPVGATLDVSSAALYPCSECGRAYSTASNLARHRQSHRSTTNITSHHHHYQQQQQRQHEGCRSLTPPSDSAAAATATARKCPHCDKVYASAPAYSMHVRTHSQGCECPQCGKRFSRPWLLQGHIRTHTGEKPFRCPHCGKTFADKSNLRAHIQTHSTDKPHVCGRCGKAFALRSYLYKHEESSCMRSHRLYHGYAYLHHQQQQQRRHQRQLSPVLRSTAISQIPCQL